MHVVFANRYHAPDISATSQIVSDLARRLATEGHEVDVITSRQCYDNPTARLPPRETVSGVRVRRVWTSNFGRNSLPGRAVDYLSFYLNFFCTCLVTLRGNSVLVCATDPPLLSIPAALACALRRARLVNWLQDIYPEVAVALGVVSSQSPLTRALAWLRNLSLKAAATNVVLGEIMAERVKDCGVEPERICLIHNWSVTPPATTEPTEGSNSLRRLWGLADCFVVQYSGNLGKAHEIDTLLEAAQALQSETDVRFLMIGAGHYTGELRERSARLGLGNFLFQPYQPLNQLRQSLAVADVHLVILRPEMEGCIVPSKFYGAAASGRPVIFVGATDGEIARILARADAGITVASGDGSGLARTIRQLRDQPETCLQLGANARKLCTTLLTRAQSLQQWSRLIHSLSLTGLR